MAEANVILGNVKFWVVLLSILLFQFIYMGTITKFAVNAVLGKGKIRKISKGYFIFFFQAIFMFIGNLLILFLLSLFGMVNLT